MLASTFLYSLYAKLFKQNSSDILVLQQLCPVTSQDGNSYTTAKTKNPKIDWNHYFQLLFNWVSFTGSLQAGPGHSKPGQVTPSRARSLQAGPGHSKPGRVTPSRAGSLQAGPGSPTEHLWQQLKPALLTVCRRQCWLPITHWQYNTYLHTARC